MLQFTVSKRGCIFDALDFPGCKHAGKFALQQIAFLASQKGAPGIKIMN